MTAPSCDPGRCALRPLERRAPRVGWRKGLSAPTEITATPPARRETLRWTRDRLPWWPTGASTRTGRARRERAPRRAAEVARQEQREPRQSSRSTNDSSFSPARARPVAACRPVQHGQERRAEPDPLPGDEWAAAGARALHSASVSLAAGLPPPVLPDLSAKRREHCARSPPEWSESESEGHTDHRAAGRFQRTAQAPLAHVEAPGSRRGHHPRGMPALGRLHQHRVALAHVEEGDANARPGRTQGQMDSASAAARQGRGRPSRASTPAPRMARARARRTRRGRRPAGPAGGPWRPGRRLRPSTAARRASGTATVPGRARRPRPCRESDRSASMQSSCPRRATDTTRFAAMPTSELVRSGRA
jgi:hypothetical protein